MAKLFQIIATNPETNLPEAPSSQVLLNPLFVHEVTDKPYRALFSLITYSKLDGSAPVTQEAGSAASSIRSAANAANTTDVQIINVTEITNEVTAATTPRNIAIHDIWKVKIDPLNSARTYIWYQNMIKNSFDVIHSTTTSAAILAAANA